MPRGGRQFSPPSGQGFLGPGGMADVMQQRAAELPEPGYMPGFLGSRPGAEEIAAEMDPVMGMLGITGLGKLTSANLVKLGKPRKFPRGAYKGELKTPSGDHIGNVYLHEGRAYVGTARGGGRGELDQMLPGSFDPKDFVKRGRGDYAGGTVNYWQFKEGG